MSWLKTLTEKTIKGLPPQPFSPALIFDLDDVRAAIALVEQAIETHAVSTKQSTMARAMKAAADPSHSFVEEPVFASMAAEMWAAEMTFPLILRRSLFIAICSHVEHVLRQWCDWLRTEWSISPSLGSLKKHKGESDLHRCMRYLHEQAGLALGDFETWPEWSTLDGCRLARNSLAHNGGIVESAAERPRIAALAQVEVDESGLLLGAPVVHLLPGACEAAAENANSFFKRLTKIGEADPRSKRSP